jgi:glutamate---cysteine ligase / carboxylate-amine ligase
MSVTFGVEEEFLVVGADGHLSGQGPLVVGEAEQSNGELQEELTRCQVESATGICSTSHELLAQLRDLRGRLATSAADRGLRVIAAACPVLDEENPPEITPNLRYSRMATHFGATARMATTCGCHVHIAIPDRQTGVQLSNHLRAWLPLLLTVTANSAFDHGADTGYCSWRYQQWSRWPSAGPPPYFDSPEHYDQIVDTMLRSGALLDRGMVYWDMRLSENQPTLEFRIGDVAATAEEATLLAVVIRALASTATEAIDRGERAPGLQSEVLRANLWRAARDGMGGQTLHPATSMLVPVAAQWDDLVEFITPGLRREAGDEEFVKAGLAALRKNGGGAQRQRRAFDQQRDLRAVLEMLTLRPGCATAAPEWPA